MIYVADAFMVIVIHFFSDWYWQDRDTAKKKSTDDAALIKHGIHIFTATCLLFWLVGAHAPIGIFVAVIYTVCHLLQDRRIWKGMILPDGVALSNYKPFWDRVALDQASHLIQLLFWTTILAH
jgi:hypothetical protein